jgi:hypothetical protein
MTGMAHNIIISDDGSGTLLTEMVPPENESTFIVIGSIPGVDRLLASAMPDTSPLNVTAN